MFWRTKANILEPVYLHAASGSLGFRGIGANPIEWLLIKLGIINVGRLDDITLKTVTMDPIAGTYCDLIRRVRFVKNGVVNAIGLINPGIKRTTKTLESLPKSTRKKLIMSLFGSPVELSIMVAYIREMEIKGIEYNPSCPNISHKLNTAEIAECLRRLKRSLPELTLRLKLDPTMDIAEVGVLLSKLDSDTISLLTINSVRWDYLFPDKKSPLNQFGGGGVSGKIAQPVTWDFAQRLSQLTKIPVVWPSIWCKEDVTEAIDRGAKHISLGSVFLARPFTAGQILRNIQDLI